MFDAIQIDKSEDGQSVRLTKVSPDALPEGDVLVDVAYSTLNYKDALAITGASPVVRSFPMVPGIDFSGIVAESAHPDFKAGDRVVLNGWGVPGWFGWSDFPVHLAPQEEMQYAQLWHAVISFVLMAVIIAHIYIGTLGMEGAFEAMGSGDVDLEWAREHHSIWADEVVAKQGKPASGTQPAE